MQSLIVSYIDRLEVLHTDIRRTIEGLSREALDWSPGPDMNSLAVLAAHTAGAERYWVGDVAGQDASGRDRDAEFRTKGLDVDALTTRLNAALEHSRRVLENLTVADIDARRISPRDGKEYTVAWALMHALEHTAIHLGHMQIVRQMWEHRQAN